MVSTVHTLYHLFGGHCVYSTYNVLRVVERLSSLKLKIFSSEDLFGELVRSARVVVMYQGTVWMLWGSFWHGRWDYLVSHLPGSFLRYWEDELVDSPSVSLIRVFRFCSSLSSRRTWFWLLSWFYRKPFLWFPSLWQCGE